jgi:hypothetical protein
MEKVSLISLLKANEVDRKTASDRLLRDMDVGNRVCWRLSSGLTWQEVRKSAEVITDALKHLQNEAQQQAMVRSEMWREAQQALYELNLAGLEAWDEIRNQGADVVESLAASIRLSYNDMTSEIRTQVCVLGEYGWPPAQQYSRSRGIRCEYRGMMSVLT